MDEVLQLSARQLNQKILNGDLSPVDVIDAHIRRIEEVQPELNAMTEDNFDQARKLAREQADSLSREPNAARPPLFGVPFTVKEMFAFDGKRRTAGSVHRRDDRASTDATLVRRMKEAGAIALATTNVPEMGFWFETENPVYGTTRNPYDLRRTSGGSSGGEGALIGAGASPLGIASDIGGSIRLPAAFCGVFGHKPTNRLYPMTGHFPYDEDIMRVTKGARYPLTTTGFLCRRAEDLTLMHDLLRGPDGIDPEVRPRLPMQEAGDPSTWVVHVCDDPSFHLARSTTPEVKQGVRNAARILEQFGARLVEWDPRLLVRAAELWGAAVRATKEKKYAESLHPEGEISLSSEIWRGLRGRGRYTVPSLGTVLVERMMGSPPAGALGPLLGELDRLKLEVARRLGPNGLLLMPAFPETAPKLRQTWLAPFDYIYAGAFNALGNPSTAAPIGRSEGGLPLSVQIVGPMDRDDLTMACAQVLETQFGGWQPPS